MITEFDHAIIGAGIHGLCTAFWLHQRGARRLLIVDQYGPGHELGSSHGATRITRSSYHEQHFVRMAIEANQVAWPRLEQALGRRLRTTTPGVFFGPAQGPFGDYLRATLTSCAEATTLPLDVARARFPLLRFADEDTVLLDGTAAMLHAAETMQALREWLSLHGATFLWHTRVLRVEHAANQVTLTTRDRALRARSVVLATGAYRIADDIGPPLTVLRQTVGYFDLDAPSPQQAAGAFPVWARIGRGPNDFHYGLPNHDGAGVKLARHRTEGTAINPTCASDAVEADDLATLAQQRFTVGVRERKATESCLYSMTTDQHFRIEQRKSQPNVVNVAACSGHGFKFGPVVGRIAADLARRA